MGHSVESRLLALYVKMSQKLSASFADQSFLWPTPESMALRDAIVQESGVYRVEDLGMLGIAE